MKNPKKHPGPHKTPLRVTYGPRVWDSILDVGAEAKNFGCSSNVYHAWNTYPGAAQGFLMWCSLCVDGASVSGISVHAEPGRNWLWFDVRYTNYYWLLMSSSPPYSPARTALHTWHQLSKESLSRLRASWSGSLLLPWLQPSHSSPHCHSHCTPHFGGGGWSPCRRRCSTSIPWWSDCVFPSRPFSSPTPPATSQPIWPGTTILRTSCCRVTNAIIS